MSAAFLALEVRRVLRAPRFLIFSVAFPVVLFWLYVGIFASGTPAIRPVLMVSMTAFGVMATTLSIGARVAAERQAGWQRQLRLTPLSGTGYLAAKVVTGMATALVPAVLVPLVAVIGAGVSLDAAGWLRVSLGVWLAALPFALIGLLIGQSGRSDTTQPLTQLVMLPMALVGGIFIPLDSMPGWLIGVAKVLPSYWLGQVGRAAVTPELSVSLGHTVLVLALWTVALGAVVVRRYRKDAARV